MKTRDEHLAMIRSSSHPLNPIATGEQAVLRPLRDIDVVLFDVYGTLLVSSAGEPVDLDKSFAAAAFRQTLTDEGLTLLIDAERGVQLFRSTIAEFHQQARQQEVDYPEVNIIEVWRTTLGRLHERRELTGLDAQTDLASLSLRYELLTNPTWPMSGAAECLAELASRGVVLGLLSNSQWFTPLLFPALCGGELEAFGICPSLLFWSYRTGWAKPSEFMFRQAAEILRERGISHERVLHVGNDMLNDILPASRVGFRSGLFAGDQRSLRRRHGDARLAGVVPDIVLLRLRDLLACVRPSQEG
jgi:putative hydrolase of the HAD superfamily